MAIKMIVTDLDGTFYHRDFTYDKSRFEKLYQQMKEQGIHFVVASGNQYAQMISLFDDYHEMTFISENGGYIVNGNKELFVAEIDNTIYKNVLEMIDHFQEIETFIACGQKSAYVPYDISEDLYCTFQNYFFNLERIHNFYHIEDKIIKFSLSVQEGEEKRIKDQVNQYLNGTLSAIVSGHGCIDLIVPHIHKGSGVQRLMDLWNIQRDEIMAFGDAENDLEMLELAGYGFVMKNGVPLLQERITRKCPYTNEEDGEQRIIEEYFHNPQLFLNKYK